MAFDSDQGTSCSFLFTKNGKSCTWLSRWQLCSDANKTATSSSHQDSEYDTASDSQSSDEAEPLHKPEPPVSGDPVGGGGGGDPNTDSLIDMVTTKTSIMQLSDGIPIEEKRKIPHDENDIHDDADGEADDDEEM